jgi:hypothetical protein
MTRRIALIASLAATLLAAAAPNLAAAPLAPSKPSQVVSAMAFPSAGSPPCEGLGAGRQPSLLGRPDGTTVPFAIPPKSVLVITSVDFIVTEAPQNTNIALQLFARDPASAPTAFGNFAMVGGLSDSGGRVFGNAELPAGLVIKPPAIPCGVPTFGEITFLVVHGFFAKDN